MHHGDAAPGWRRLAAYVIDFGVIAVYVGLLTAISNVLMWATGADLRPPTTFADRLIGQSLAFLVLTLPVVLYFALTEASRLQGTVGKHVMRLRVITMSGDRASVQRSLIRSAVKFAPWEVAHTAIWHIPGQPFVSEPAVVNLAGFAVALGLAGWYVVSLFLRGGRTPYDRISGTRVVAVNAG